MLIDHVSVVEGDGIFAEPLIKRAEIVVGRIESAAYRAGSNIHSVMINDEDHNPVESLPTDLISYVVQSVDDLKIALKIQPLITDGRVHIILLLSLKEFPQNDCSKNLFTFPTKAEKVGSIFVVKDAMLKENCGSNLVHAFQLTEFARSDEVMDSHADAVITEVLHRKRITSEDFEEN